MSVYEVDNLEEFLPIQDWCQEQSVRLCVLFGSQATGKTHAASDVDLAVWPFEPVPSAQKLHWVTELQGLLRKEISLVIVSPDLDPVLGFEIVKHGRLLFQKEPELWLKERSRLWHAYNDSLPFRGDEAYQQWKQFIEDRPHSF